MGGLLVLIVCGLVFGFLGGLGSVHGTKKRYRNHLAWVEAHKNQSNPGRNPYLPVRPNTPKDNGRIYPIDSPKNSLPTVVHWFISAVRAPIAFIGIALAIIVVPGLAAWDAGYFTYIAQSGGRKNFLELYHFADDSDPPITAKMTRDFMQECWKWAFHD